jgi:guanine deaminase
MHMDDPRRKFMQVAIDLARNGMKAGVGGPFGCVIVKDGQIIAKGSNAVTSTNDPTAHAEVVAIREACKVLGTHQLNGCDLYTSCEPCPMCLGAIYWARPDQVYYGCNREDAAAAGFDDKFIYDELECGVGERKIPMFSMERGAAARLFEEWNHKDDKLEY